MEITALCVARHIATKSQSHLIALVLLLAPPALRAEPPAGSARARFLMGTTCAITAPNPAAVERGFAEIDRIERMLSSWKPDSEIARLHRAPAGVPQPASAELVALLEECLRWSRETGGAFNPLLGPLVEAWDLRGEGRVPPSETIAAARERAAIENLHLGDGTVTRGHGAAIEEGAFGKGYALDRALDAMRAAGAPRALIDFGGQVAAYGFDGGVEVGIAHPESRERAALALRLREGSVSTSSGSEKRFSADGREFSHLIDPRSGDALPPNGSVTVIHASALAADILSTALYVLGPDEGLAWADARGIAAIFLVPTNSSGSYSIRLSRAAQEPHIGVRAIDEHFKTEDATE